MQVSVETTSELGRKVQIAVPEERMAGQVEERLRALARQVRIDGFRPGKAPLSVVKKMYQAQVRDEVVQELIESTLYDALTEQNLLPAGPPAINHLHLHPGEGFHYDALFEVYPEIQLVVGDQIELVQVESAITDTDVAEMLQRLQQQRRRFEPGEQPAQMGDRVIVTADTSVEGAAIDEARLERAPLILGSNRLPHGFDNQLVGAAAGDTRSFDLEVASDYPHAQLAGKTVHFAVEVLAVEHCVLPALDAEFAQSFGIESGDLDELRQQARANMERDLQKQLQTQLKQAVMDALLEQHPLTLPIALVRDETRRLAEPYREQAAKQRQELDLQALTTMFENMARRRVALGLILRKAIEQENLTVDAERVRVLVEEQARGYEDPDAVIRWYYEEPERLQEFELLDLENQVVGWVLERARIRRESRRFFEVMYPQDASTQPAGITAEA